MQAGGDAWCVVCVSGEWYVVWRVGDMYVGCTRVRALARVCGWVRTCARAWCARVCVIWRRRRGEGIHGAAQLHGTACHVGTWQGVEADRTFILSTWNSSTLSFSSHVRSAARCISVRPDSHACALNSTVTLLGVPRSLEAGLWRLAVLPIDDEGLCFPAGVARRPDAAADADAATTARLILVSGSSLLVESDGGRRGRGGVPTFDTPFGLAAASSSAAPFAGDAVAHADPTDVLRSSAAASMAATSAALRARGLRRRADVSEERLLASEPGSERGSDDIPAGAGGLTGVVGISGVTAGTSSQLSRRRGTAVARALRKMAAANRVANAVKAVCPEHDRICCSSAMRSQRKYCSVGTTCSRLKEEDMEPKT
mgnify:CR=1 FL=1